MNSIIDALNFRELGVFNSREIAILICITILLLYCLSNKNTRNSLLRVIDAMFAKQLTFVYFLTILYSLVPIAILYNLGFWKTSLIKDITFWFLLSALPVLYKTNKAGKVFFTNILKDNLKFTVITDFITSQNTFHVFIEILRRCLEIRKD